MSLLRRFEPMSVLLWNENNVAKGPFFVHRWPTSDGPKADRFTSRGTKQEMRPNGFQQKMGAVHNPGVVVSAVRNGGARPLRNYASPNARCERRHTDNSLSWNAVYTRHQHEKLVADSLRLNGIEVFFPTYEVMRQWADRKKRLALPLFSGYVFLRCNVERRLKVLTMPGLHSLLMFNGKPAMIPEAEISAIRRAVESKYGIEPHPFLDSGDKVRVKTGSLKGLEGLFIRRKSSCQLILAIDLLGKAIAVEMNAANVVPLPRPVRTIHQNTIC
jgi:transcription antitermination factor NusG